MARATERPNDEIVRRFFLLFFFSRSFLVSCRENVYREELFVCEIYRYILDFLVVVGADTAAAECLIFFFSLLNVCSFCSLLA